MSYRQSADLTRAIKLKDLKAARAILQKSPNLLRHNANLKAKLLAEVVHQGELETFKLLVEFNVDASRDPLEVAMNLGDIGFAEAVLQDSGLPKDATFAYSRNTLGSRKEKLQLLLKHGLEVDDDLLSTFIQLHVDKYDSDAAEVASVLLDSGPLPDLARAIHSENLGLVSCLIKRGSDVNLKNLESGFYPVHQAVRYSNEPMMKLLIAAGADLDARDDYGWTALHLACYLTRENLIATLIFCGADVNARTQDGMTPFSLLENTWKYYGGQFEVMVTAFARLSFQGLTVPERDMEKVMANPGTRALLEECTMELEGMKSTVIYGGISYFGVLKMTRNVTKLVRLTRNSVFVKKFHAGLEKFVHYRDDLTRIFYQAVKMRDEMEVVGQRLNSVFGNLLPDVVIRKVREHLRIDDLPV